MRKKAALPADVGRRVRELRRAAKLTQQQLSQLAGLNGKYLGELENGHRDVRLTTLARIGKALKVEVGDLLRFSEVDVTLEEVTRLLQGRDEAFRAHVLRLVREVLLLVDSGS